MDHAGKTLTAGSCQDCEAGMAAAVSPEP
jgi:hypothetical protein